MEKNLNQNLIFGVPNANKKHVSFAEGRTVHQIKAYESDGTEEESSCILGELEEETINLINKSKSERNKAIYRLLISDQDKESTNIKKAKLLMSMNSSSYKPQERLEFLLKRRNIGVMEYLKENEKKYVSEKAASLENLFMANRTYFLAQIQSGKINRAKSLAQSIIEKKLVTEKKALQGLEDYTLLLALSAGHDDSAYEKEEEDERIDDLNFD